MSSIDVYRAAWNMFLVFNDLNMFSNIDHPYTDGVEGFEVALNECPDLLKKMILEDVAALQGLVNICDTFIGKKGG